MNTGSQPERGKRTVLVSAALKYTGLFVFAYLLLLSISYTTSPHQPLVTLFIGIAIWFWIRAILLLEKKYGSAQIFLAILLIGSAIRFLWAIFVPTIPFSDFLYFHENAIQLSQGVAVLTKNMGYTLLLSAGYRMDPSVLTGKLMNAVASMLSIWFVYVLGLKLVNRQTGLIAAFLFAILPSEITMVSVLGTEVVATTLGVIVAFFLVKDARNTLNGSIFSLFVAGLFYGLGLTVRSSFLFFFPAILLWVLWLTAPDYRRIIKSLGGFFVGIVVGLSLVLAGYSLSTKQLSLEPLRTQDSFPFLSGTNIISSGMWNQEDADLYFSWPADQRDAIARQEAIHRIKSQPVSFLLMIPRKFAILMAPDDYGINWSSYGLNWGIGAVLIAILSQSIYIVILVFAFWEYKNSKNAWLPSIAFVLVLSTLAPHMILEVQSRYHHYIMPFITLLAASGQFFYSQAFSTLHRHQPVASHNPNLRQ